MSDPLSWARPGVPRSHVDSSKDQHGPLGAIAISAQTRTFKLTVLVLMSSLLVLDRGAPALPYRHGVIYNYNTTYVSSPIHLQDHRGFTDRRRSSRIAGHLPWSPS